MTRDVHYHTDEVEVYLRFPGLHLNSNQIRLFWVMGDRTASAILKVLYPFDVIDSETQQKILNAVRISFESPDSIELDSDRLPAVSVCILEWLIGKAETEEHRESIKIVLGLLLRQDHGKLR